jgi:hypothetical protein
MLKLPKNSPMKKLTLFLFIVIVCSCRTQRITILDGVVIEKKRTFGLCNRQDTIEYVTLHNGKVMSLIEFNQKWDKIVEETTKRIKEQNNKSN